MSAAAPPEAGKGAASHGLRPRKLQPRPAPARVQIRDGGSRLDCPLCQVRHASDARGHKLMRQHLYTVHNSKVPAGQPRLVAMPSTAQLTPAQAAAARRRREGERALQSVLAAAAAAQAAGDAAPFDGAASTLAVHTCGRVTRWRGSEVTRRCRRRVRGFYCFCFDHDRLRVRDAVLRGNADSADPLVVVDDRLRRVMGVGVRCGAVPLMKHDAVTTFHVVKWLTTPAELAAVAPADKAYIVDDGSAGGFTALCRSAPPAAGIALGGYVNGAPWPPVKGAKDAAAACDQRAVVAALLGYEGGKDDRRLKPNAKFAVDTDAGGGVHFVVVITADYVLPGEPLWLEYGPAWRRAHGRAARRAFYEGAVGAGVVSAAGAGSARSPAGDETDD